MAGGQRVDAPYVPYKNARAGRASRGEKGGGERGGGCAERRRGGEWGSDAGEEEAVRVGAMEAAGDPGRSSPANKDDEGSGPWAPKPACGPAVCNFLFLFS